MEPFFGACFDVSWCFQQSVPDFVATHVLLCVASAAILGGQHGCPHNASCIVWGTAEGRGPLVDPNWSWFKGQLHSLCLVLFNLINNWERPVWKYWLVPIHVGICGHPVSSTSDQLCVEWDSMFFNESEYMKIISMAAVVFQCATKRLNPGQSTWLSTML